MPSWTSTIIWVAYSIVRSWSVFSAMYKDDSIGIFHAIGTIYNIGQMIYWWIEVGRGIHDPHHAPWLDPGACTVLFALVAQFSTTPCIYIMALMPLAQFVVTFYTTFIRFTPKRVGAIAYTLLSSFSTQSLPFTEECSALITNPISDIYIDHVYNANRIIQAVQFAIVLIWGVYFCAAVWPEPDGDPGDNNLNFVAAYGLAFSLAWSLVGLIWLGIIAAKGAPFAWNDACGVVVVGMSSKLGYWDAEFSQNSTFVTRVVRAVFALCKPSTFFALCNSQLFHLQRVNRTDTVRSYGFLHYGSSCLELCVVSPE